MLIRILESHWEAARGNLLRRQDVETAGFFFARVVGAGDTGCFVSERYVPVPDVAYLVRRIDQLRIDPVALNRLVRPARDAGLAVITIHTHPGATEPWFSWADDRGDARLMPSFAVQIPGRTHGSMVLAGASGTAVARLFDGERPESARVHLVGRRLSAFPGDRDASPEAFARQQLALGAAGQALLHVLKVGVVGLGGTGSVVAAQLSHMGLARLVLVDGDLVEEANRSRIIHSKPTDVGTPKVEVSARYAGEVGLTASIESHSRHLLSRADTERLAACDVVFSCVDRHTPRALLNRLAYEAAVPVIDMGSVFRVDGAGAIVASAGRVVVIGPGRPCLACWGHIDPSALRVEALDEEARAAEEAEGYIQGARVSQPSVIAFNTAVGGAAVVEFLRLVTGFAGADAPPDRLAFAFAEGTVRRNRLAGTGGCVICTPPT